MNRAASKAVHYGVGGVKADNANLVPYCELGYRAFKKGSLTIVNPNMAQVTCKHCIKEAR